MAYFVFALYILKLLLVSLLLYKIVQINLYNIFVTFYGMYSDLVQNKRVVFAFFSTVLYAIYLCPGRFHNFFNCSLSKIFVC